MRFLCDQKGLFPKCQLVYARLVLFYFMFECIQVAVLFKVCIYSTGRSQHNTDFTKTNQNEVMRIRTNFFEDFRIRKLICENEFVILNL